MVCLISGTSNGVIILTAFHLISFPDVRAPHLLVLQCSGRGPLMIKAGFRRGQPHVLDSCRRLEVPAEASIEETRRSRLPPRDVTALLQAWSQGDRSALDELVPKLHADLHRLAHKYMNREREGHTLQTTALINETYLRLVDAQQVRWQHRAHFFAVAAGVMRHILVDYARSRLVQKRGRGAPTVCLEAAGNVTVNLDPDVIALNDALSALETLDHRKAKVVELRFFGGLTVEETAEVLHISADTVSRDWKMAKVWLLRELKIACADKPRTFQDS